MFRHLLFSSKPMYGIILLNIYLCLYRLLVKFLLSMTSKPESCIYMQCEVNVKIRKRDWSRARLVSLNNFSRSSSNRVYFHHFGHYFSFLAVYCHHVGHIFFFPHSIFPSIIYSLHVFTYCSVCKLCFR